MTLERQVTKHEQTESADRLPYRRHLPTPRVMTELSDWTASADPDLKYFSTSGLQYLKGGRVKSDGKKLNPYSGYCSEDPLQPSGLLGPVRLLGQPRGDGCGRRMDWSGCASGRSARNTMLS